MRRNLKVLMTLTALMALTACDRAERADLRNERTDRLYQSAMDDYRSGRIDAAVSGFEKVIRADPANASARFQLACLLQDSKRDHLGAYFGYREYLLQHPESDKAPLARDRMAKCEKELAKMLASKYGLSAADGLMKELEVSHRELKAVTQRAAAAESDLAKMRTRLSALLAERTRLIEIVKGEAAPKAEEVAVTTAPPSVKEAKDLLDELDEDETDRVKMSKDVALLRGEEDGEKEDSSSLLPTQTPEDVARREAARAAAAAEKARRAAAVPKHPPTYIVEDGDTLYGVARRFYGRKSAWKLIKEANKTLIPADNRLRAGDTLKLP